jgi:phosphate:Na+ symporter
MVIGLVNSGLLTLHGAIGVVIGANIGTTITGWVLALQIGKYGLPMIGVAAFVWLFAKNEALRYTGLSVLGVGMIFFGLELMKDGFAPVKEIPDFVSMFQVFRATDYLGVLKSALVGCVLTFVVQSSSATLGITIALANTGVIDFQTAAALVLGENIGTTITAYLASLGADDVNAKRAAYFHIFFNVTGVAIVTAIFLPIYVPFITNIVLGGTDPNLLAPDGTFPYMTAAIATSHSVFNLLTAGCFMVVITPMTSVLTRFVCEKPTKKKTTLTRLDFNLVGSPVVAIEQSTSEIMHTDQEVRTMLDDLRIVITAKTVNRDLIEKILEKEKIINDVQSEVTHFLTDLLAVNLSHRVALEARTQLRLADELESVSDYITNILKLYLRLNETNFIFSPTQQKELLDLHDAIAGYYDSVREGFTLDAFEGFLSRISVDNREITESIRSLRSRHWSRLSHEVVAPLVSTSYMDIANAYRRVKDHLLNIGEAMAGGKDTIREDTKSPKEVASV